VLDGVVGAAGEALAAGEVVEHAGVAGVAPKAVREELDAALVVASDVEVEEARHRLPPADGVRLAGGRAHDEHGRAVLSRERCAPCAGVADEDHRPRGSVDLLAVDRERGPAGEDAVELLVPAHERLRLGVLGDDRLSLVARVRVDPEAADVEVLADRASARAARQRVLFDLVQVRDDEAHRVRSSSSTTGSMRSTPSTRSSRFSFPAQALNASSRSPS
jgi:hypothetical protein